MTKAKFVILKDLGHIEVPADYNHTTALASFKAANRKEFLYYADKITDSNFPRPSKILKPGDRLRVFVFGQDVARRTTTIERMDFLREQRRNVLVGAQGAALVFVQKRIDLPKDKWHTSFDEADRLYCDARGVLEVSILDASWRGSFGFRLASLHQYWYRIDAFLCFCELPSDA